MAGILLWGSSVRVQDSQAYRKMDVTRERISRILELREVLLSFQCGFNLVNAAVVCAILESISGLEPWLVIAEPRYLKLVTVWSFCPAWIRAKVNICVLYVWSYPRACSITMLLWNKYAKFEHDLLRRTVIIIFKRCTFYLELSWRSPNQSGTNE